MQRPILQKPANNGYLLEVNTSTCDDTKTTLSGCTLSWSANDKIGVYCLNRQYNRNFSYTSESSFSGYFDELGESSYTEDASYIAYYPYIYNGSVFGTTLSSTLSSIQTAPFDSRYDYAVSAKVNARYDEGNMPSLSFVIGNHLFSIIKIDIVNTSSELQDQLLSEISITAGGNILAGGFSFDVADPLSGPIFSSEISALSDKVTVRWESDTQLGLGEIHTVYAIVNSFENKAINVSVKTTDYEFSLSSKEPVTANKGEIVNFPSIDLGILTKAARIKRTLAYWGDSIATTTLTDYLQWMLGDDWLVINCGASGDTPLEVAGRNGCIPMRILESVQLPGDHNERAYIGTQLFSDWDSSGNYNPGVYEVGNKSWFNVGTNSRLNNCVILDIECLMTRDSDGKYYIQRIEDGEDAVIPALTEVKSYASLYLRNVDLLVTYMGTNGFSRKQSYLATLANVYKEMTKYKEYSSSYSSEDKHDHIIVGFHHRLVSGLTWWSQDYHNYFTEQFGNYFLDLRVYGNTNAERLLCQTGVYACPSMISELDRELLDAGDWPASWQGDYQSNVHPNPYGSKAIAIMVYEKMQELGYLDD